jgi:hypothetical protein
MKVVIEVVLGMVLIVSVLTATAFGIGLVSAVHNNNSSFEKAYAGQAD